MIADTPQLSSLGTRLREERLLKNESQQIFAARIGVSIPTLRKMEFGDPGVTIGYWMRALEMLGRAGDLDALLAKKEDLFAKYEAMTAPQRKRARKA